MTVKIITANRLSDGAVVFQTESGVWSEWIGDAAALTDEAAVDAGLEKARQAVAERRVVEAYEIEVAEIDGLFRPLRFRERIRALGPTNRKDHGNQADRPQAASAIA